MVRKPVINQKECIGCGTCAADAGCPEVFEMKESKEHEGAMKSFVKVLDDYEQYADKIDAAINLCPVTVISWKE